MSASLKSPIRSGVITRSQSNYSTMANKLDLDMDGDNDTFENSIKAHFTTSVRSPLQDLANRSSVFLNMNSSKTPSTVFNGRVTVNGNDYTYGKIEAMEREKLDHSVTIRVLEEKERSHRNNIDHLSTKLRQIEESKQQVDKELLVSKQENITLQNEKDELANEVRLLSREKNTQESLWTQMTSYTREMRRIEDDLKDARKEKNEFQEKNESLIKQMEELKEKLTEFWKNVLRDEKEKTAKAVIELDILSREYEKLSEKMKSIETNQNTLITTITDEQKKHYDDIEHENQLLKQELSNISSTVIRTNNQIINSHTTLSHEILQQMDQNTSKISILRQKLHESETSRRKLHNQLQEIRGNIRVFVRCRPLLTCDTASTTTNTTNTANTNNSNNMESDGANTTCVRFHGDGSSISLVGLPRGAGNVFTFDNVFQMNSSQDDVFSEVTDLIQSSLDGYRVGYNDRDRGMNRDRDRGILPRAMEQIIERASSLIEIGWEVSCTMSIVELYNEELRDLLVSPSEERIKLKICQHNAGRGVLVEGLESRTIDMNSMEVGCTQLENVMNIASKHRTIATTNMNEQSSRSHVLYMFEISCTNKMHGISTYGGLRLVDLAGSERLDRTGTLGDAVRLRETVNINKSLSCLSDVFLSLNRKAAHIPYRNSKLTMLLQDCLSGDGKALMIANISPTMASAQETYCSLKFASQVNQVELGKAHKNVVTTVMIQEPPSQQQPPSATKKPLSSSTSDSSASTSTTPGKSAVTAVSSTANHVRRMSIARNIFQSVPSAVPGVALVPGRAGRPSGVFPTSVKRPLSVSSSSASGAGFGLGSDKLGTISESNNGTEQASKRFKSKTNIGSWR
eukprot:gene191-337_t